MCNNVTMRMHLLIHFHSRYNCCLLCINLRCLNNLSTCNFWLAFSEFNIIVGVKYVLYCHFFLLIRHVILRNGLKHNKTKSNMAYI